MTLQQSSFVDHGASFFVLVFVAPTGILCASASWIRDVDDGNVAILVRHLLGQARLGRARERPSSSYLELAAETR